MLLTGKPFLYFRGCRNFNGSSLGNVAKDLPEQHKMVNDAEKRFITQNRDIVATEKSLPPWKRF